MIVKQSELNNQPKKNKKSKTPFAAKLRFARLRQGLTQQELAEKMNNNITPEAITMYETGNLNVSKKTDYSRFSKALGVKEEYFTNYRPSYGGENYNFLTNIPELNSPVFDFDFQLKSKLLEFIKKELEQFIRINSYLTVNPKIFPDFDYYEVTEPFLESSLDAAEQITTCWREFFNLGLQPIQSVSKLLEEIGFLVFEYDDKFINFIKDSLKEDKGREKKELYNYSLKVNKILKVLKRDNALSLVNNVEDFNLNIIFVNRQISDYEKTICILKQFAQIVISIPDNAKPKEIESFFHNVAVDFLIPSAIIEKYCIVKRRKILGDEFLLTCNEYKISPSDLFIRLKNLDFIHEYNQRSIKKTAELLNEQWVCSYTKTCTVLQHRTLIAKSLSLID